MDNGHVYLWTCGQLDMWTCGHVDMLKCGHVHMWHKLLIDGILFILSSFKQSMSQIRLSHQLKASKGPRWRIWVPELKDIYPWVNIWKPALSFPGLKPFLKFRFRTWSVPKIMTLKRHFFAQKSMILWETFTHKKAYKCHLKYHTNVIQIEEKCLNDFPMIFCWFCDGFPSETRGDCFWECCRADAPHANGVSGRARVRAPPSQQIENWQPWENHRKCFKACFWCFGSFYGKIMEMKDLKAP